MNKKIKDKGISEIEDEIYSFELVYKLYFGISLLLILTCVLKLFIEPITQLDETIIVIAGVLYFLPMLIRKYIYKMMRKIRLNQISTK